MYRTKICAPDGSPCATHAIRDPSGDHRAVVASSSQRFLLPSVFMSQSDDFQRSFILSTHHRV